MLVDISELGSLLKTNLNNQLIAFNSIQYLIQFVSFILKINDILEEKAFFCHSFKNELN
jgi:hypothetical protein